MQCIWAGLLWQQQAVEIVVWITITAKSSPQSRIGGGVAVPAEQQVLRNEVQSHSLSLTQGGRGRETLEGSGACGSFLSESWHQGFWQTHSGIVLVCKKVKAKCGRFYDPPPLQLVYLIAWDSAPGDTWLLPG